MSDMPELIVAVEGMGQRTWMEGGRIIGLPAITEERYVRADYLSRLLSATERLVSNVDGSPADGDESYRLALDAILEAGRVLSSGDGLAEDTR